MCTHPKYPRLVKDGWEFCLYYPDNSVANWLRDSEAMLPDYYRQRVVSIKHLDSGIAFRFSAPDALYKRIKEKQTRNPLASDFPSYNSPLLSELEGLFDSAYVGRVVLEKQSEEPIDSLWKDVDKILDKPIDPIWENVDQKTLDEQIVLMTKNEHVSGEILLDSPFENRKSEAKKTEGNGMVHPLVNFVVITDLGWFLQLEQPFSARCNRVRRLREVTMHCFFKQNIIYSEIIETQHENFEKRLSEYLIDEEHRAKHYLKSKFLQWFYKTMAIEDIPDDEPLVYFHEVRQLRIQDLQPPDVRSATRYSSHANDELKTAAPGDSPKPLKALPVPDSVIKSLFSGGKLLQHIEEHFGSSIEVFGVYVD